MGIDECCPNSAIMTFKPPGGIGNSWDIPPKPEQRPWFISAVLNSMGQWRSCFVWRHMGSWHENPNPNRLNDRIEFQILKGLGMPLGTADIVEFAGNELDQLITLLFSTTIFGWSVGEDLYVVPDHAKSIFKVSHHNVVRVFFRDASEMHSFAANMEREGFSPPKTVPDPIYTVVQ